jgi:phosphate transport system substrate-binding protein
MRPPLFLVCLALLGCRATNDVEGRPVLRYVGSSTIGQFIRDAESPYGRVDFQLDTEPESAGGELAILEGRADIAGVAGEPREATLAAGVTATLVGHDAIAVIGHPGNGVASLSTDELAAIFTGRVTNWSQLGGADMLVRPFVVGPASATRKVFRAAVLGEADYAGCDLVRPDSEMVQRVAAHEGAIGQISLSFLDKRCAVEVLAVDGATPQRAHSGYPITRPLYLLWWPGRGRVSDFVEWTRSTAAQDILRRRFASAGGAQ